MGALDTAVRQGKALYVGHQLLLARAHRARRSRSSAALGTPLLIHQPSYSMLNRWIEDGLLDVLERHGVGAIVFSPLAQGLLTDRYLDGIPEDSRVRARRALSARRCSPRRTSRASARCNEIAAAPRPDRSPSWRSPGSCATRASARR